VRHRVGVVIQGSVEKCGDVALVGLLGKLSHRLSQFPARDQDDGVLVIDDLNLGLVAEEASGDEDADPTASQSGDHPSYLVGAD